MSSQHIVFVGCSSKKSVTQEEHDRNIEVFAASFGYPSAASMTALLGGEVSVEAIKSGGGQ